jgi:hypothetical protein
VDLELRACAGRSGRCPFRQPLREFARDGRIHARKCRLRRATRLEGAMTETDVVQALLEQLQTEPLYPLEKSAVKSVPDERGVYVIYDAAGNCIKVGRTPHGRGLRERLRRHEIGNTDRWLEWCNGDRSKLGGRQVRWLVVDDPRQRCLLEGLATGVLCPQILGLGQKADTGPTRSAAPRSPGRRARAAGRGTAGADGAGTSRRSDRTTAP